MSDEPFNRKLDCYPSDLEEDNSDFYGFDEEDDDLDMCEFDEHDWEPVLIEGGFYVIYECSLCGLIDGI